MSHQDSKVSKITKVKIVFVLLNQKRFVFLSVSASLRLSVESLGFDFLGVLGVLVAKNFLMCVCPLYHIPLCLSEGQQLAHKPPLDDSLLDTQHDSHQLLACAVLLSFLSVDRQIQGELVSVLYQWLAGSVLRQKIPSSSGLSLRLCGR